MKGTLLWLNGWGMTNDVFEPVQKKLPDFKHLCPDFCDVSSEEDFYKKVHVMLLQSHWSKPLYVIGWSLGGILAQRLAVELSVHSLILLSSTACFVREKEELQFGWADAYLRQMQVALKRDRGKVISDFRKVMFTPDEQTNEEYMHFSPVDHWSLDALTAGLTFLRKQDVRSFLSHITCPTYILHGTSDMICPFTAAEEMAKSIPQALLVPFEECGHVPFWMRRTDVCQLFKEVLI